MSGPGLVLLICCVTVFGGFLFKGQCLQPWDDHRQYQTGCYNDLQPLFIVREIDRSTFPYVNGELVDDELVGGAIEYPVLTGVFMWASGLTSDSSNSYLVASAILLAPFGLYAAYLLARLSGPRALMFAAAPAIVLYAFHNWDFLVVAAVVGAIFMWARGRYGWAGVLLGVGAALKMYPLVFLAPLLLERLVARDRDGALNAVLGGVGTFALINLPFIVANRDGWLATYTFHQQRGADFNSIWHWATPSLGPEQLNPLTLGLVGISFLAILGVGLLRARRDGVYPFLQACGAMLAVFLLFNKVHSPQYALWILPFFVVLRVHWLWWAAYSLADLVFYFGIFRWFYDLGTSGIDDGLAKDALIGGLWVRAALLLLLTGIFMAARPALIDPVAAPVEPEDEVASYPSANVAAETR